MRLIAKSLILLLGLTSYSHAQTQEQKNQAKWIFERITGVKWPADHPLIVQSATLPRNQITALAVQQPQFLNVTVKNFALEMSTREETILQPLNDFAATVMGVVRDNTDARELLYGNFYYVGDPTKISPDIPNVITSTTALSKEVLQGNGHFAALDSKVRKIDVGAVLVRVNGQKIFQSITQNDPETADDDVYNLANNPDPAGVLTSRTWINAHAVAGTNRRPVEYTFRQFMCLPIEQWADAAAADIRIGRDIDRFPGGDHMMFQTSCKACHTVMDGFRGAWAKWNMNGITAQHTDIVKSNADANGVMNKLNQNNTVYPSGYVTTNDSWINNAIRGVNATQFGWRGLDKRTPASTGSGVRDFGRLVANSERFSTCMAKRVFKSVCRNDLPAADIQIYKTLGQQFESYNYNLKSLFQLVALHSRCK